MSETYAQIQIAGVINSVVGFNELVKALTEDRPCYDKHDHWIDGARQAEDFLLSCVENGGPIVLHDQEAEDGEFEHIEKAAKKAGLWFNRTTSQGDGLDAEEVTYDPVSCKVRAESRIECDSYVTLSEANRILDSDGSNALAAYITERTAEAALASGQGMPDTFTVSEDVLKEVRKFEYKVVLTKTVQIEVCVRETDKEMAREEAENIYSDCLNVPDPVVWDSSESKVLIEKM